MTRPPQTNTKRALTLVWYQLFVVVSSFVVGIVTARALGAYGRGVYAVAFVPPQLVGTILASGVSEATIYTVVNGRGRSEQVLRLLLAYAAAMSVVWSVVLVALWFPLQNSVLKGVGLGTFLLATVSLPCLLWMSLAQAYLFAGGRTAASQAPAVAERVGTFVAIVTAAAVGAGVDGIVTATSFGAAAGALAGLIAIGRRSMMAAFRSRLPPGLAGGMLRYAGVVFVSNFAQKLTYRLDQLIVNVIAGPTVVGIYALSARLAEMPLIAPRALRSTWVAARAREDSIEAAADATLAGGRKLVVLMATILPVYGLLATPLIPWLYGPDFAPARLPFVILLGATFVLSASFPFVSGLTGGGKPGRLAVATSAGLLVTVALDVALVPSLGSTGAAAASLASYGFFSVVVFLQWRAQAGPSIRLRSLIPTRGDASALVSSLAPRLVRRWRARTVAHRSAG